MSTLAKKLPSAAKVSAARVRKGPNGACDVYGPGDLEDWAAIDELRRAPLTWEIAQHQVDKTLGIPSINVNKFRYHWRGKCWHWTPEQADWIREQS